MPIDPETFNFVRGRVYYAIIDPKIGEKPFLVVSNNGRNNAFKTALVVRLTSTDKKIEVPTIVETTHQDPFYGRVLCDDIFELWPDEVRRDGGALTPETMMRVGAGLKAALAL